MNKGKMDFNSQNSLNTQSHINSGMESEKMSDNSSVTAKGAKHPGKHTAKKRIRMFFDIISDISSLSILSCLIFFACGLVFGNNESDNN